MIKYFMGREIYINQCLLLNFQQENCLNSQFFTYIKIFSIVLKVFLNSKFYFSSMIFEQYESIPKFGCFKYKNKQQNMKIILGPIVSILNRKTGLYQKGLLFGLMKVLIFFQFYRTFYLSLGISIIQASNYHRIRWFPYQQHLTFSYFYSNLTAFLLSSYQYMKQSCQDLFDIVGFIKAFLRHYGKRCLNGKWEYIQFQSRVAVMLRRRIFLYDYLLDYLLIFGVQYLMKFWS